MSMNPKQLGNDHQASEQRYRHLFENAPICIFVADLAVTPVIILECNRRAELVYGYSSGEMVGMTATELVPEETQAAVQNIVQRVRQGQTVTVEITNQRRDCTIFPVRVIAAPDPADASHMIITVEDITAAMLRRSEAEAIDAERRRIAREIHDGVAQSLAGLRFKSALWYHLAEDASPEMRQALEELQEVLTEAIVDIRRSIFALRPMDLESLGFIPALTQLVGDFGDQNQLATELELSGQPETLPSIYELPLFRIIQESLNNTGQHARASSVLVHLDVSEEGRVTVSVRDNGCGFDPSRIGAVEHAGHFGLIQMRERALALGGTLDILSAIDQGTELCISLPPVPREIYNAAD
jgi:PAS domain S-box-containing protein